MAHTNDMETASVPSGPNAESKLFYVLLVLVIIFCIGLFFIPTA